MRVPDEPARTNPKLGDTELAPTIPVRAVVRDRLLRSSSATHSVHSDFVSRAWHEMDDQRAVIHDEPTRRRILELVQRARLSHRRTSTNCTAVRCSPQKMCEPLLSKRERSRARAVRNAQQLLGHAHVQPWWHCIRACAEVGMRAMWTLADNKVRHAAIIAPTDAGPT